MTSLTIPEQLDLLKALQKIDTALYAIAKRRGDLPQEIARLQHERESIEAKRSVVQEKITEQEALIEEYRAKDKQAEALLHAQTEKQKEVTSSREYDQLTKSIAFQDLEVRLARKNIKVAYHEIELQKNTIEEQEKTLESNQQESLRKEKRLAKINEKREGEEQRLQEERQALISQVSPALARRYQEIYDKRNALAVVHVAREACTGCWIIVPPQQQINIEEKKEVIECEHCGRLFSHVIRPVIEKGDEAGSKPRRRRRVVE